MLQIIRVIDQFCSLNKLTWIMHGRFVRLMLNGSLDAMTTQPLEFVIGSSRHITASPVEVIANNLHINGFVLETKTHSYAKLYGTFLVDTETKAVSVVLRDAIPFSCFTCDSIVIDSRGITLKNLSATADNINVTKGLGLIERLFDLQEGHVTMDTVIVPYNHFKAHKHHNVCVLEHMNDIIGDGFKLKGANINITCIEGDCAICMESGRVGTVLQCNHAFCLSCLENILRVETCPRCSLCRAEFVFALQQQLD